jgi:hypothetical protein
MECGLDRILQRLMAFRHRVLADQHQQARSLVESRAPAKPLDGEVEPQLGEVRIDAVALRDPFGKGLRLQRHTGFESVGAVLGAEVVGHGNPRW